MNTPTGSSPGAPPAPAVTKPAPVINRPVTPLTRPVVAVRRPPAPTPPAPVVNPPVAAAEPAKPAPVSVGPPSGEAIMQRLRYFENLCDLQAKHMNELRSLVTRTGTAIPSVHFPVLRGAPGDFDPNDR